MEKLLGILRIISGRFRSLIFIIQVAWAIVRDVPKVLRVFWNWKKKKREEELMNYFELALGFATKLMDKIPNYDPEKKNKWHKLLSAYNTEKVKPYFDEAHPENQRDDDKLMNLRDELKDFMTVFNKEQETNATVH